MLQKMAGAIAISKLALLLGIGVACLTLAHPGMTQDAKTTYPKMAPLEQYLMPDQAEEIALARTAAPASISHDAEVMVLGRKGFETAVKGKNGFVCIVERSWTSTADPDFWNPQVRTPICYNAAAARSVLLRNTKRTTLVLEGRAQAQVDEAIAAAVDKKVLPGIEPGALCYMMSKQGYGGDSVPHWPAHLMFFFPQVDLAIWGANLPGSPVIGITDDREHATTFVIAVQHWSDGTESQ